MRWSGSKSLVRVIITLLAQSLILTPALAESGDHAALLRANASPGDALILTHVTAHRPDAYPILGGLAGGAIGAMFGYQSGHDGYDGGDVYSEDTRPGRALGFGLGGAVLGMLLGTVFAPTKEVSTVLW